MPSAGSATGEVHIHALLQDRAARPYRLLE
jgi:hypothetical protein